MRAADIKDGESFQVWLEALPEEGRREIAVALAHRAALRVLPIMSSRRIDSKSSFFVAVFRCNAVARVASKYPNHEIVGAARATETNYYADAASA